MFVRYSYLPEQFNDADDLWNQLKDFVKTGDFTLGKELEKFEKNFSNLMKSKYAIGVNSGTDAIKLSLKALNVKAGDEVITSANTFVATVGAINEIGAKTVFVDCDDKFCMNVDQVESKITSKTKAVVPVHFSGYMTDMPKLMNICDKNNIHVVEDACQSILAEINNKLSGTWGATGCFSLHPLKNINVWSDGGIIITNSDSIYEKIKLLRNHGLLDRDHVEILGYNSRLDTFQSIVANWLLPQANEIADKRISNAKYYDESFSKINGLKLPVRPKNYKIVYHLYMIFAERRDELYKHCLKNGIEAKIHYPIPMYLQNAMKFMAHKKGDFPEADYQASNLISFPCDQYITKEQQDYVIRTVNNFYK